MISDFKTVFVLAPHTDDGELGAGGTISRLIETGSDVHYLAFCNAEMSVPQGHENGVLIKELFKATSELGIPKKNVSIYDFEVRKLNYARQEILEELIIYRKKILPDLVLLPSTHDIHQDHKTISEEGIRAFKGTSILGYELIWNNLISENTSFVELKERHLIKKIKSCSKYASQAEKEYMSKDFISSLAKTRGVQVGLEYAECFQVIRWINKVDHH